MAARELRLDGRTMTLHDEGVADGPAIVIHHGTPVAGAPFAGWLEDVLARGARLLAYDRPGYGGSTPQPDRTVADAAADTAAIMDALGIERFVTWGISGGGPHVLACAALLPGRVVAAASLAGIAPFDAPGLNWFRGMGHDNLVEFGLTMAGREQIERFCDEAVEQLSGATPAQMVQAIASLVSEVDRPVLLGPVGEYWSQALPETFAQGAAGWVDDDLAFARPFGFELDAIAVPTLVMHGRQDRFVPVEHGHWLAGAIPAGEPRILDDEGHLSLCVNQVPAVHEWLLEHF